MNCVERSMNGSGGMNGSNFGACKSGYSINKEEHTPIKSIEYKAGESASSNSTYSWNFDTNA